jgi:hypothetical protein
MKNLEKIQLSVTDMCNRKCNICPHVDESIFPNKKVWMEVSTAEKLAIDLVNANYMGVVSISGYGEPLLHPKIFNIITQFTKRNIQTRLHTNADLLYKGKVNYKILDRLRLKEIVISTYDGEEQYINYLAFAKSKLIYTPYIFRNLYVKEFNKEVAAIKFLRNRAGTLFEQDEYQNNVCHRPLYNLQIDWDGSVLICCDDWKRKITYGNILTKHIKDIWLNDQLLNEHRRLLVEGKRSCISTCSDCNSVETNFKILNEWNLNNV